ncbi:MAG TPA: Flp family type IVb pilin [Bacillota bacterium]|nr:Flp family type IVb pilin [Bacillota bacterium]
MTLKDRVLAWLASEEGATITEYALLLALVVVVLIATLSELGTTLQARLQEIIDRLNGAIAN